MATTGQGVQSADQKPSRRADLAGCQVGCAAARRVAVPVGGALGAAPVPVSRRYTVMMIAARGSDLWRLLFAGSPAAASRLERPRLER
jgi:hypothetical protein